MRDSAEQLHDKHLDVEFDDNALLLYEARRDYLHHSVFHVNLLISIDCQSHNHLFEASSLEH